MGWLYFRLCSESLLTVLLDYYVCLLWKFKKNAVLIKQTHFPYRMNWTLQIRTGRPCLRYPMRRNGRSTAVRRRWVGLCCFVFFTLPRFQSGPGPQHVTPGTYTSQPLLRGPRFPTLGQANSPSYVRSVNIPWEDENIVVSPLFHPFPLALHFNVSLSTTTVVSLCGQISTRKW